MLVNWGQRLQCNFVNPLSKEILNVRKRSYLAKFRYDG